MRVNVWFDGNNIPTVMINGERMPQVRAVDVNTHFREAPEIVITLVVDGQRVSFGPPAPEPSREQRLVDIMIECLLTYRVSADLQKLSREELVAWARKQLLDCGFPNVGPVGMKWCVLSPE